MQITITATLGDEQAYILASRMGYLSTITNIVDGIDIGKENPQTPGEFIKEVYEKMIANDVAKHFIAYKDEQQQAIWEKEDQQIRDNIQASISSKIN